MTDDRVTFTVNNTEMRGAVAALNALDVEYEIEHVIEFRVAVTPADGDEESLQELTELAGETEDTGGQEMLDSDPVTFEEHAERRDDAEDDEGNSDPEDRGDSGNSTGGRSTTDTISGGLATTDASSTTKQFGANDIAITNLDSSGAAGDVYGALANTNREWATSEELPIANVDVESQGYTSVSDVLASLWKGDILERRELDERRGRCLYEYRIAPEGDDG